MLADATTKARRITFSVVSEIKAFPLTFGMFDSEPNVQFGYDTPRLFAQRGCKYRNGRVRRARCRMTA